MVGVKFKTFTRIPNLPSNKLEKKGFKSNTIGLINKKVLNFSTFVIAQTNQMKDEVIEYYGVNRDKIIIISNIVDKNTIKIMAADELELSNNYNYIASGSLYYVKGFDLLIEAFAIHITTYPTDRLYIIGKETVERGYRTYLEQMINDLNLIRMSLYLGISKILINIIKMQILLLSSLKEGFPNVVPENIVIGTPVVVTDCIDFSQIVSSEIGYYKEEFC